MVVWRAREVSDFLASFPISLPSGTRIFLLTVGGG